MIKVLGSVDNVFTQDGGKNAKGEEYDAVSKVQIIGRMPVSDGQYKTEILELKIEDTRTWEALKGKKISIDVRPYSYRNNVGFSVAKGAKPQLLQA